MFWVVINVFVKFGFFKKGLYVSGKFVEAGEW